MRLSYLLSLSGSYYPPEAVPSVAFADLLGNGNPEMIFSFNDGFMVGEREKERRTRKRRGDKGDGDAQMDRATKTDRDRDEGDKRHRE